MENWKLLELTGPIRVFDISPNTGEIIYALGSTIIIWDIDTDEKSNIRCHTQPILSISFNSSGHYFLTLDFSSSIFICIWQHPNNELITSYHFPGQVYITSPPESVLTLFIRKNLIMCENFSNDGYTISNLSFTNGVLTLRNREKINTERKCLQLIMLNDFKDIVCIEEFSMHFWDIELWKVTKRFNFQIGIKKAEFCKKVSLFVVLLENRTIVITDKNGKTVTKYQRPSEEITSISVYKEDVFISTNEGLILSYNLRTFSILQELPIMHHMPIFSLSCRSVSTIFVIYNDATVQIIDHRSLKILCQSSSHSQSVKTLKWGNQMHFFSVSKEPYLFYWKHVQKGWSMQALQLSQTFKLKTIAISSNNQIIYCGFDKGLIKAYQLDSKFSLINEFSYDDTSVIQIEPSFYNKHIVVLYKSGYFCIINSFYKLVVEIRPRGKKALWFFDCIEVQRGKEFVFFIGFLVKKDKICVQMYNSWRKNAEKVMEKVIKVEGNCTGFKIHTSGRYLLCTCPNTGVHIFDIESSSSCGLIEIPYNIFGCFLDPIGLYICVCIEHSKSIDLLMYTVGTGEKVASIQGIEKISIKAFNWSREGNYIILGSKSGSISVWKCPQKISQHIQLIQVQNSRNPNFWDDFSINLPTKALSKKPSFRENDIFYSKKVDKIQNTPKNNLDNKGQELSFLQNHSEKQLIRNAKACQTRGVSEQRFRTVKEKIIPSLRIPSSSPEPLPETIIKKAQALDRDSFSGSSVLPPLEDSPIKFMSKQRTNAKNKDLPQVYKEPCKYGIEEFYVRKSPFLTSKITQGVAVLQKSSFNRYSDVSLVDVESSHI